MEFLNMDKDKLLEGLTPEQIEKLENCKSVEDILRVASEENYELTDEQLDAVTGGVGCFDMSPRSCPVCKCPNMKSKLIGVKFHYICKNCGYYL